MRTIAEFRSPWGETYRDVEVKLGQYADGSTALQLIDRWEGPLATATVCLAQYGVVPEEIAIKTWSENEGLLEELVKVGLIELTGREWRVGEYGVRAVEARLTEES